MENGKAAPSGFVKKLHEFTSSNLFLVGCILYSAGIILGVGLNFTPVGMLAIAYASLPVAALWIFFYAAKTPKIPDDSTMGLTFVKVHAIIGLVFFCLVMVTSILGLTFFMLFSALVGRNFGVGGEVTLIFFLMLTVVVLIFVLMVIFYYKALFNVIKSVRDGIQNNHCNAIKGAGHFSVMGTLLLCLSITANLFVLVFNRQMNAFMNEIFDEMIHAFTAFIETVEPAAYDTVNLDGLMILLEMDMSFFPIASAIFSITASAGGLLIILTLMKFAASVREGAHGE